MRRNGQSLGRERWVLRRVRGWMGEGQGRGRGAFVGLSGKGLLVGRAREGWADQRINGKDGFCEGSKMELGWADFPAIVAKTGGAEGTSDDLVAETDADEFKCGMGVDNAGCECHERVYPVYVVECVCGCRRGE